MKVEYELRCKHGRGAVIIQAVWFPLSAVEATIKFTYVEKYPDESPLWEIQSQENLEDPDVEDILTLLQQQVRSSYLNILSSFILVIIPCPLHVCVCECMSVSD